MSKRQYKLSFEVETDADPEEMLDLLNHLIENGDLDATYYGKRVTAYYDTATVEEL